MVERDLYLQRSCANCKCYCLRVSPKSGLITPSINNSGLTNSHLWLLVAIIGVYTCLITTKPVFGVSDKVRFKPVSSATETRNKTGISLVANLGMVLSKTQITRALIRLRGWFSHVWAHTVNHLIYPASKLSDFKRLSYWSCLILAVSLYNALISYFLFS